MAQRLTWQNVAAPDFSAAAQIMSQAGKQIEQGTGNIADLFADARKRQIDTRSSEAIGKLAGIDGSGNADAILQQVLASTAPKDRNDSLNAAIYGAQTNALGLDNTRSQINTREEKLALARNEDGRANTRLGMDQTTFNRRIENEDAENSFARAYAGALGQGTGSNFDFSKYTTGGAATRDTAIAGMRPEMQDGLAELMTAADNELGGGLQIYSGYRSPEHQASLVSQNMGKYGFSSKDRAAWEADVASMGAEAAGEKWRPQMRANGLTKWVAMPGGSKHQSGQAADLMYNGTRLDQAPKKVQDWVRQNASRFGLSVPMSHEPWQVETADARGGIRGTSVSELMPEGGRFTFDQMTKFQDRLGQDQTAAEAAVTERMRNRVQEQVYSRVKELGPNQPLQTLRNEILGSDMSPVEKEMFLQEATRILGENEGYFSPLSTSALETQEVQYEVSDIMGTIDVYNTAAEIYNPSAAQYGDITLNGNAVDATGEDGTPRINNSGSLAAQVAELESVLATEDDPRPIDRDSLLAAVQRISENTGLPSQVVMSAAKNSLTNASWLNNKITVDEDILLGNLSPYLTNGRGDPAALERAASSHRQREKLTADADRITSQMDAIATEHAVFSDRPDSPEVRERLKVLGDQYNAQLAELRKIQEQARSAAGVFDQPEADQDDPAAELLRSVTGGRGQTAPAPLQPGTQTPGGNAIDPQGTGFDQFVDRQQMTNEINRGVSEITTGLALGGGAVGPRVFSQIADFFTATPTEAASNRADRATRTEALKWFQSTEARNVLRRDPLLMVEAEDDPVAFWRKYK